MAQQLRQLSRAPKKYWIQKFGMMKDISTTSTLRQINFKFNNNSILY